MPRRSTARRRPCMNGSRRPRSTPAGGPVCQEAEGGGAGEPGASPGQRHFAQSVGLFRPGEARPPVEEMIAFIDDRHDWLWGRADLQGSADRPIRPITSVWRSGAIPRSFRGEPVLTLTCAPDRPRVRRELCGLRLAHVRKVWQQMQREGLTVAGCTMERLMREMGLQGAIRNKLLMPE